MIKEFRAFAAALIISLLVMFLLQASCGNLNKESEKQPGEGEKLLYERNLKDLVRKGNFVLVDENESDRFIQEDIYSTDYGILLDLSMIKAETMGIPLYTENLSSLGGKSYIERIHPTDRKAKQTFLMIETSLLDPSYFEQKKYLDNNFNRAEAMNKKETVNEMVNFIDGFPDSKWTSRAFSYIEYILCAYKKDPDSALKIYEEIKNKHKDNTLLKEIADKYIERAYQYKQRYMHEKSE